MKSILSILLLFSFSIASGQSKFYKKNGKKVPIIGEQTLLEFDNESSINRSNVKNIEKESLIPLVLPSLIDLGFKISTELLKSNLKKFTSEFSAKQTYNNTHNYISGFKIERKIRLKNSKEENKTAFEIQVKPIKTDEIFFVFAVTSMKTLYSGAKTKSGYNANNYNIEIKLSYFDGKDIKEQTSAPIVVQLFDLENINYSFRNSDSDFRYLSDKFLLDANFTISKVEVKITEINTAKANAEKMKAIYDSYSEDLKNLTKTIVNFYVEK